MITPAGNLGEGSGRRKQQRNSTSCDLFPDTLPPVSPALWPSAGTRAAEALEALLTGPQNQADYPHGWRLAASIQALEYDGWVFLRREICRPGCRRPIAEYGLDLQAPAVAAALAGRHGRAA